MADANGETIEQGILCWWCRVFSTNSTVACVGQMLPQLRPKTQYVFMQRLRNLVTQTELNTEPKAARLPHASIASHSKQDDLRLCDCVPVTLPLPLRCHIPTATKRLLQQAGGQAMHSPAFVEHGACDRGSKVGESVAKKSTPRKTHLEGANPPVLVLGKW